MPLKVLSKYYPKVAMSTPSIGRKGKALRRQNQRRYIESELHVKGSACQMKQNFPAESKTGIGNLFSCFASSQHIKMMEQTKYEMMRDR